MGKTNYTDSGHTTIQAGRIGPRGENDTREEKVKAAAEKAERAKAKVRNIKAGNARVGVQTDGVIGNVDIRLDGRS
ncbi:hypothetical protein ACFHYQ_28900 [Sphaerimonospora cavernae]|uniref:CsbD family protein n=1 Tax=Sphaerimonospora cavernae TaxID=1740611 RepID=A0ABV6UDR6_9ACTN